MTSKRKIRTNKENAQKSTGPKTDEGKRASSKNSYKHGIWAKQLKILDDERGDYKQLVTDLGALLKPNGPILQYFFDEIVLCMWRLKKLVSFENSQFRTPSLLIAKEPTEIADKQERNEAPRVSSRSEFEAKLVSSERRALKEQLKALESLQEAISRGGVLRDDQKRHLAELFGQHFVNELESLLPSYPRIMGAQMGAMMRKKTEVYGVPLIDSSKPVTGDERQQEQSPTAKDRDPKEQLVAPESSTSIFFRELLSEVVKGRTQEITAQLASDQPTPREKVPSADLLAVSADLQLRYSAALKRDLKKAIDAYYYYQRLGLAKSK